MQTTTLHTRRSGNEKRDYYEGGEAYDVAKGDAQMLKLLLALWRKYRSILAYLIVGFCTTVISVVVYTLCSHLLHLPTAASTVIAWTVSVSFSFVCNKMIVFESKSLAPRVVAKEAASFFACRIAAGVFDLAFMVVTVDLLKLNDMVMKIISNAIVIVANYITSRFVIFKKHGGRQKTESSECENW